MRQPEPHIADLSEIFQPDALPVTSTVITQMMQRQLCPQQTCDELDLAILGASIGG